MKKLSKSYVMNSKMTKLCDPGAKQKILTAKKTVQHFCIGTIQHQVDSTPNLSSPDFYDVNNYSFMIGKRLIANDEIEKIVICMIYVWDCRKTMRRY
jgi:hypothetical protein